MSLLAQPRPQHPVTGALAVRGHLAVGGTVRIPEALAAVRLLREASALAATVEWSLEATDVGPLWQLAHLPPPRHAVGLTDDALERWRARYRYALCYYRRGPGFVVLRDERRGQSTSLTITDPAIVTTLEALRDPRPIESLDAGQRSVLPPNSSTAASSCAAVTPGSPCRGVRAPGLFPALSNHGEAS